MQPLTEFLVNIKDTSPDRELGSLHNLKKSLQEVGLINPLTIDTNRRLLAGRRRLQAMLDLGWEECQVTVLDPEDEIDAKMISLHENIMRKPLTDAENRRMIAEIDELMRKKHGNSLGGQRTDLDEPLRESPEGWSDERTAKKIGTSQRTVSDSKRAKAHVDKHPELKHEKTPIVLDHKKKEDMIASLSEKDRVALTPRAENMTQYEVRESIDRARTIEHDIDSLLESPFKTELGKKYLHPYTKFETNPEEVRNEIRAFKGLGADQKREGYDKLIQYLERWEDSYPELATTVSTEEWKEAVLKERKKVKSLTRIDYPITKFGSKVLAEEYAHTKGGYCGGKGTIGDGHGGRTEVWLIFEDRG